MNLDHVIAATDAHHIYEVPLNLHRERLDDLVVCGTEFKKALHSFEGWKKIDLILKNPKARVKIAVVGKYVDLKESYKSLNEALIHGGISNQAEPEIQYVDSDMLSEKNVDAILRASHGVLVPGGFGPRGVAGKMLAIQWARENKIPFFGICYGMQLAAIEFARHVCGIKTATSREWEIGEDKRAEHVIDYMIEQRGLQNKGGTMRLGSFVCTLAPGSRAAKIYGAKKIFERHRHRYEFNNKFRDAFVEHGMLPVGMNTDRNLVEILEIKDHPWFIGVQFHPEFKSKPLKPHPLFAEFIKAALKSQKEAQSEDIRFRTSKKR